MYVEIETREKFGIIWLKHERTNSLNHIFLKEIHESLQLMAANEAMNIIVIASKLKFGFSSGLDLRRFYSARDIIGTGNKVIQAVKETYRINHLIRSSAKTYLAALSGPVIGSAISIALSCDLRISDEKAWFWAPDPQFGGLPGDGVIEILSGLVGASRAKMLLLTNDRIDSKTAWDWGLLYKVVPHGQLYAEVFKLASRLSGYSSLSLGTIKGMFNKHVMKRFTADALAKVVYSDDTYSRMKSYFEPRNSKEEHYGFK